MRLGHPDAVISASVAAGLLECPLPDLPADPGFQPLVARWLLDGWEWFPPPLPEHTIAAIYRLLVASAIWPRKRDEDAVPTAGRISSEQLTVPGEGCVLQKGPRSTGSIECWRAEVPAEARPSVAGLYSPPDAERRWRCSPNTARLSLIN